MIDWIGVIHESTTPITIAARNVRVIERSCAMSAAASDEITRKVRVVGSSATRSPSSTPAMPDRTPQPNHAAASTRRTGTPRVAVMSRSLAMARIVVPSLVKRRKAPVTAVMTTPTANPMTSVQVTWTWPTMKPLLSVGSVIARDWPPLEGHSRSMAPSRISVRPSVAAALTSGSRRASTGPNTIPYSNVTTPPNNTQIR